MFIILCAHIPRNWWTGWIPARFGFSDATEIFVFCSGMASAIAFGGTFIRRGWYLGTMRIIYRVWQVYWAHIGLFFFVAMNLAFIDHTDLFEKNYIASLNLGHFFKNTSENIIGLFTLTYVPNYFDILPMYLVILAMVPFVMLLSQVSHYAVFIFLFLLWFVCNLGMIPLPAEPWSSRQWFFNPFGWQLIFFTGFALRMGWLPIPPINNTLITLCFLFIILCLPFSSWKVIRWIGELSPETKTLLQEVRSHIKPFYHKTEQGILRYAHFMSLAYLGYALAGEGGNRLLATGTSFFSRLWKWLLRVITKVGQQSLAVFVFSMALARIIGFALDQLGRNWITVHSANLVGFVLLIIVAYSVAYFRSQPWRKIQ